jgi:hypothetical protein
MADLFMSLLGAPRSAFRTRAELTLENLALRQQLANLRHTSGRPRIHMADRAFWLVLSRLWSCCLVIIDLKLGKFTHADAGQMSTERTAGEKERR